MENKDRKDVIRDHDYDGIEEYDNKLPNWWVGTFIATVLFGVFFWMTRHVYQTVPSTHESYQLAMKEHIGQQEKAASPGLDDEGIRALVKDPAALAEGKAVFGTNCAACHAPDGGGLIGPNLTDKYWIHGNHPTQIIKVITNGVPEKGMVPWKGVLNQSQINHVAAYILSLQGSTPAKAKEPQGTLYE